MKFENKMIDNSFEQGPIRPPSEAGSLLLRFTRNCPWNKCTFCITFKTSHFERRSLEEIYTDIDTIRNMLDELYQLAEQQGFYGVTDTQFVNFIMTGQRFDYQYKTLANWLYRDSGTAFIQDANSLIMKTSDLTAALRYLRERIPEVRRVTSYARSNTVSRKSAKEIQDIHEAGLDRVHIGLESGSDEVLKLIRKGTTAQQHIDCGVKLVASGITLSEYVIPGMGGRSLSQKHARETAKVLNAIDPHFIRLRSLRVIPGTPLEEMVHDGDFDPPDDEEIVHEIYLLLSNLDLVHSYITSDHIRNLLEDVKGQLPDDKESMLRKIEEYLAMPDKDRLLFRIGRRGGRLRSPHEIKNPIVKKQLHEAYYGLSKQYGDIEEAITELGKQFELGQRF